jgi:hypothetical protein
VIGVQTNKLNAFRQYDPLPVTKSLLVLISDTWAASEDFKLSSPESITSLYNFGYFHPACLEAWKESSNCANVLHNQGLLLTRYVPTE